MHGFCSKIYNHNFRGNENNATIDSNFQYRITGCDFITTTYSLPLPQINLLRENLYRWPFLFLSKTNLVIFQISCNFKHQGTQKSILYHTVTGLKHLRISCKHLHSNVTSITLVFCKLWFGSLRWENLLYICVSFTFHNSHLPSKTPCELCVQTCRIFNAFLYTIRIDCNEFTTSYFKFSSSKMQKSICFSNLWKAIQQSSTYFNRYM